MPAHAQRDAAPAAAGLPCSTTRSRCARPRRRPGSRARAEANTNFKETKRAAAGDDADASSSESDSTSSSSDSSDSDSDSEAAAEKRRVAAALEKQRRAAEAEAKAKMQPPPRSGVANLGVLAEPPPPSQAHRAALAAERAHYRAVRVAHAFGGKGQRTTIEVKKGAVTSMATAKSGRAQVLAAGTSQGELVVWKILRPRRELGRGRRAAEGLSRRRRGKIRRGSSPGTSRARGNSAVQVNLARKPKRRKPRRRRRRRKRRRRRRRKNEKKSAFKGNRETAAVVGARGVFVPPRG